MSLAHRVIPVLLMRNGMLVKGKKYDSSRIVGNVMQSALIHQAREVDELMVIDVGATQNRHEPDYEMIRKLTARCFMPITVGGGIRSLDHVRQLLANGADKVLIGTFALQEPEFITACAKKFGSQAVVVSVDAVYETSNWYVTSHNGKFKQFYGAAAFAKDMETRGAGELLLNAVNNDGMMAGYDIALTRKVAKNVDIPVIANCGCGSYEHMRKAINAGASAVAAGAFFQWTDATPHGACEYLAKKGLEVRL